ncbi:MAG TPA: ROK family transcriptional regulator [Candidatus Eisenbacteria bacterium]|jgi:predicted NBD/HSP70 family sugar kinase|nr:ROK family transcriptional regulator [Candidatus Eisenbacteria bacterium]
MALVTKRRLLDQIELNDHEKKNLQILDTIRKKGPIARAEISRLIGLNIVTVTSYIDQYIKKGVIKEVGIDVSSGGRKPTLVDLNPSAIYLIGVGLNVVDMIAVLCNLKGEILVSVKKERPLKAGEALVQSMTTLVQELIEKSKVDTTKVHGIGIGIPGIFNRDTSTVRWPVGLLEGDLSITVSIHGLFEEKFGIPTFVDNDANAAVFGEEWYGRGLGVQHAIYLYSGNGCGFMINGQIYRGANGCAGEWLFDIAEDNPLPALVESYKSGSWSMDLGIALRAQTQQAENAKSKIYEIVKDDVKRITLLTVVKASEMGDPFAIKLLKEAGARLGRKAAFLVNLFNPEILIIGGGIELGGALLLDALRDTVKQSSVQEATEKLRIIPSQLGENGVPLGAAALVAQNYFISV